MSRTPTSPSIPSIPQKHKSGTSYIQHQFENAFDILSKNTQQYMSYLKYLTECSKQLKKMNEVLSGLVCGKNTHPELKDIRKIFDTLEKSNKDMRSYIKSDEVKNAEKRESKENDFTAKKKQELKKILGQISNLHNNVIRIIKKPPDCTSCFNALEDGFTYHCDFLAYCTELTNCQEKLFGLINEIREEVLNIRKDMCSLKNESNNNAYKNYLKHNPQFDNIPFMHEQNNQLSSEAIEKISLEYDKISKQVKRGVSIFREPQFPLMHLYHFSPSFKPLTSSTDADSHIINVTFCASTPLLIEPEKLLSASDKSPTEILSSDLQKLSPPDQNDNSQEEKEEQEPTQVVEDFLDAYKSDSSDDEPFHALNSSFTSVMTPDSAFDNQWGSAPSSPMNSAPTKSVSSNDLNNSTNYHQKITNILAARPRSSMKFIVMKQYNPEDFGKELSVEEKDIVEVLDANMTEYWYCKKGNTEGFLPAIILEPATEISKRKKSVSMKEIPPSAT